MRSIYSMVAVIAKLLQHGHLFNEAGNVDVDFIPLNVKTLGKAFIDAGNKWDEANPNDAYGAPSWELDGELLKYETLSGRLRLKATDKYVEWRVLTPGRCVLLARLTHKNEFSIDFDRDNPRGRNSGEGIAHVQTYIAPIVGWEKIARSSAMGRLMLEIHLDHLKEDLRDGLERWGVSFDKRTDICRAIAGAKDILNRLDEEEAAAIREEAAVKRGYGPRLTARPFASLLKKAG